MKRLFLLLSTAILFLACPSICGQTKKDAGKLLQQATALMSSGDIEGSSFLCRQAKEIYESLGMENTFEYANAIWLEVQTFDATGDVAAYEEGLERLISIMRPLGDKYPEDFISILCSYAGYLYSNGMLDKGLDIENELDAFYAGIEKPGKKVNARYYAVKGWIYNSSGRLAEARPLLEKACEEVKAAYGKRSEEYRDARITLAQCYQSLLMARESKALAIELLDELKKDDYSRRCDLLLILAGDEESEGSYEAAVKHYQEVESILREQAANVTEYLLFVLLRQATCYTYSERFEEALSKNSEALQLITEADLEGTYTHLSALSNLAVIYSQKEDIERLITTGAEIQKLGHGDINCSSALLELSQAYISAGQYGKAESCLNDVLLTIGDNPYYQTIRLYVLEGLFTCAGYMEDHQKLIDYALPLLEQYEKLGRHDYAYNHALAELINAEVAAGNYQQALVLLEKARKSVLDSYGPRSEVYASVLSGIASSTFSIGLADDAIATMTEAVEIFRDYADSIPDQYFACLKNLAEYEYQNGKEEESLTHLNNALDFAGLKWGAESLQYVDALSNILNQSIYGGDLYTALKLLRKNFGLLETHLKDSPAIVSLYSSAAIAYQANGDTEQERYYSDLAQKAAYNILSQSDSLEERLKCIINLHSIIPRDLFLNLWNTYIKDREEELRQRGPDYYVFSFASVCKAHCELGNYEQAYSYGKEVLDCNLEKPEFKMVKFAIAITLYNAGYSDLTLPYIKEYEAVNKNASNSSFNSILPLAALMADSYNKGDYANCNEYSKAFIDRLRKYIKSNFSNMSFAEKSAFWAQFEYAVLSAIPSISINNPSPEVCGAAYDGLLIGKGILLSSEVDLRTTIKKRGDKHASELLDRILMEKNKLGNMPEGPARDSLNAVISADEDELVEISADYGDYMKSLTMSWKDVQKNLAPGEAAIEFTSYNDNGQDNYIAFIVKRGSSSPVAISLFNAVELKAVTKERFYDSADLFNLIWKPLEGNLKGVSTVYFSPSGELNNIPIEYLPNSAGLRQNQRYKLFRLTSTREIERRRSTKKAGASALYGGIDYNAGASEMASANASIPSSTVVKHRSDVLRDERGSLIGLAELPGTLKEIDDIQSILETRHIECNRFDGPRATEESFKSLSGSAPSILHIATHGFYWNEVQARNNSFLPSVDGSGMIEEDKAMSRSGLFLAGANNSVLGRELPDNMEDGILTARDISMMDLQGTDLLVMAACKSGLGEVKGDGVFGLQRGFKKAGVHTIVMSLWNVDDDATRLLMTSFYTALLKGNVKPVDALSQAQETVRIQYPDPKYWAAFIMLDGN